MDTPSEHPKTGMVVLYRLLCLPYFCFITIYWSLYLFAGYLSYAVWNNRIFFSSNTEPHEVVKAIIADYLPITAAYALFFKVIAAAYSWVFLSPLKLRLYNESKKLHLGRLAIEFLALAVLLITPLVIAHLRYNYFGLSKSVASNVTPVPADTNKHKVSDKDVKRLSILATDRMRVLTFKGMDGISLGESVRLRPDTADVADAVKLMKLKTMLESEGKEAELPFRELADLVRKSDEDKHWAHLQAVTHYSEICKRSLALRMISVNSRDWTREDGDEARRKIGPSCCSLRDLLFKENIEARRKMDTACDLLKELPLEDCIEARQKLNEASDAITEGCIEAVKFGFFVPKEGRIDD
jgi:hypothetical protein